MVTKDSYACPVHGVFHAETYGTAIQIQTTMVPIVTMTMTVHMNTFYILDRHHGYVPESYSSVVYPLELVL